MQRERIAYLTFDVVATLIDFETGILEWWRPWLRRHGRRLDDARLLADFAAAEDELQRTHPEMPFTQMLGPIHDRLAAHWQVDADESSALDFRDSIRDWPAFVDAVPALRTLGTHYRLVAVTNADAWALARMSETLGQPFHDQVTTDEVGATKPNPAVWRYTLDKIGAEAAQVMHCSRRPYRDLASAHSAGLATAHIERGPSRGTSDTAADPTAACGSDVHVRDLTGLVQAMVD